MRKIVEVVEGEGLNKLLGEVVTLFCINYFYTGTLIGVNEQDVLLQNPSIVFETGSFEEKMWKNAQKLPNDIYVRISAIEAYGKVK